MAVPPVEGSELSSEDSRAPSLDLAVSVPGRAFRGTVGASDGSVWRMVLQFSSTVEVPGSNAAHI